MSIGKKHFLAAMFAFFCLLALFALEANSQTICPPDTVCLTPTEMKYYLMRDDAAKAFEAEVKALRLTIEGDPLATDEAKKLGWRGQVEALKEKFAAVSGEYTGFKMGAARVDAAFDTAIKNTRKKCGFGSICLN